MFEDNQYKPRECENYIEGMCEYIQSGKRVTKTCITEKVKGDPKDCSRVNIVNQYRAHNSELEKRVKY